MLLIALGILLFQEVYSQEIDLNLYEKRLISQNGEDGIIQKIFELIGTTSKYYVEFGAGEGHYGSNTKYLRGKYGWQGLLLEGSASSNHSINLHKEFITAENICDLFAKYNVPHEFDFLSVDIDRNDWHVWRALGRKYRPRVVIIECNQHFTPHEDRVIVYNATAMWDGTEYTGASVHALYNLGRHLGYSLVCHESAGANVFFIRDDVIQMLAKIGITFKDINNVEKLYRGTPLNMNRTSVKFVPSLSLLR